MNFKQFLQASACALIAAIGSLTMHIYIRQWVQPYINAIIDQGTKAGVNFNLAPSIYSWLVIGAAYLTAIVIIALYVFLYYHVQHLIPGKTVLVRTFIVVAMLFGIKGDLLRQPIMNFIVSYESLGFFISAKLVALDHIDKWLANIFLAICLVNLCPKKYK